LIDCIGWLAPLWPFIGICVEVIVLIIIIAIYENRRSKQLAEEARKEEALQLYVNGNFRYSVNINDALTTYIQLFSSKTTAKKATKTTTTQQQTDRQTDIDD